MQRIEYEKGKFLELYEDDSICGICGQKESLSKYEAAIFRKLIQRPNTLVFYDTMAKEVWEHETDSWSEEDFKKWTKDSFNNPFSKLKQKILKVAPDAEYLIERKRGVGCLSRCLSVVNSNNVEDEHNAFVLDTLQVDEIFNRPQEYIEPVEWLDAMSENAFLYKKVHAISGERGLGKTELARCFAAKCKNNQFGRSDLVFNNVIFTSYLEQGLENTIALLACSGESEGKENYESKIKLLTQMPKPTLLIIDNYDNEESCKAELSEESTVYRELRNTGCHILFTSKIDMRDCYGVDQTKISRLATEELLTLFNELSDEVFEKEVVCELIEKYLMSNTYLVRLAARLTEKKSIDEIIRAFKNLKANEMGELIQGKDNHERTLFEHFSVLFNLSSFGSNKSKCQMLYNLALLPLEGVSYSEFFLDAFEKQNDIELQKAFNSVKDSFWVFLNHRKITMHPIVREMIAQRQIEFEYKYIRKYIDELNRKLYFNAYEKDLPGRIKKGVAAYEILERMGEETFEIACMVAKIASDYDIIGDKELAYEYGVKAFLLLKRVEKLNLGDAELYELAQSYNMVGYAILHAYNKRDSVFYSEEALYKASEIIGRIHNDNEELERLERLYTINQGDIAALYIVKKDYQKALEVHGNNVLIRQRMIEVNPSRNNRKLLAASYKGMATAMFYLSSESNQNKEKLLYDSYKYHALAVKCYEEAYQSDYHFDIAVADNRKVGTLCCLIDFLDDEEKRKFGLDAIKRMDMAIKYLLSMEPQNQRELTNSRKNLSVIIKKLKEEEMLEDNQISEVRNMISI